MSAINQFRDWTFRKIHSSNLVYNTCWEDPRCDRELLELNAGSEVVMITSAGCNALDYLLDSPAKINCVDMNPRQNALLELKLASFEQVDFEDLFRLFGQGVHPEMEMLYVTQLREALPYFARQYWDKNLHFFEGKGLRKTFYHYSTSGALAWITGQYLKAQRGLYRQIRQMFEAETLDRQAALYHQIERRLLNQLMEWALNRHFLMCLVGVPRSQQLLFVEKYDRGAAGFVQECLRRVFTQQPVSDNYFWRLYFDGHYDAACCPSYLQRGNFETIRGQVRKIETHTATISQFLKQHPGQYSHFVLLDHQDWLAANDQAALEEEWQFILANSKPGARILLRSAAEEVTFFPDFVKDSVVFEKEKTRETHLRDRVGTYASVYLGIVQ
ncbi:MAG: BtaA family protein [Saprospiraceae bacterium]|nr:BtaA family protein [Saprospiraceae bacterium]